MEAITFKKLVKGHAYSITGVEEVSAAFWLTRNSTNYRQLIIVHINAHSLARWRTEESSQSCCASETLGERWSGRDPGVMSENDVKMGKIILKIISDRFVEYYHRLSTQVKGMARNWPVCKVPTAQLPRGWRILVHVSCIILYTSV